MSDQGYIEQTKAPNRAVKPALITLLLAGTAGIYSAFQAGPTATPEPVVDPVDDGTSQAVGTPGQSQTSNPTASVVPEFGKAPAVEPAVAPAEDISASLASAATSAAKSVKETVSDAIAAAVPERRSGAIARIELPAPAPEPAPVQRIVLPEATPAAPIAADPVAPAAAQPEPALAAQTAAPAAAVVEAAATLPAPVEPQAPVQRSEPAPALAAAPAFAPSAPAAMPAPAQDSGVLQAFAETSFAPLSETRLAGLRPIGGDAVAQAAPAAPVAKSRPVASLANSRATVASRPSAAPKLAMQAPKASSVQRTPRQANDRGPATRSGLNGYRMVGNVIEFRMPVRVNGEQLGRLTMHIAPDDQISLHLKELVSMFEQQLDPQLVSALKSSPSINEFVSFERLRAAGIDIRYDAASNQVILAADQS